ncbi:MAG: tRNA pseudouridine(38-40) synthase TruA [Alphaproteobacteria bacterium]
MTQRYKITIEYNGQNYSGWQRQPHAMTIQQAVEEAIRKFSSQDVAITVAGRTDAGVHALGQVANFDLEEMKKPLNPFQIMKAINAHLVPQPISVVHVEEVHSEFNARFDALNKLYRYRVINRNAFLTHDRGLAWLLKYPIDVDAMREGAKHLLGNHDFTTFRDSECQAKSPIRTLDRLDIAVKEYDAHGGKEIVFEIEGKSFLHHQVRNMVGTLSLVGRGKWHPKDMIGALEAKNRAAGGPTCPADGLYLVRIDY